MVVDDEHPLHHVVIVAHKPGENSGFSLESRRNRSTNGFRGGMMSGVSTASPPVRDSRRRAFRVAVVTASVVAAIVGSVALARRDSGEGATTRGVIATLRVPGHPGPMATGSDAVWLGLAEAKTTAPDLPLLRLDLATGTVTRTVRLGGRATHLAHIGDRLIASIEHVDGEGSGPSLFVALDWRTGDVLLRRQFAGLVGPLVRDGDVLWALQVRPAALLRLDPQTLQLTAEALPLAAEQSLGMAVGAGYVWATVAETGEVLRIDPENRTITRKRIGGSPVGIVIESGSVWVADRDRGAVVRLDPQTLKPVGDPVSVAAAPSRLATAGRFLYVGNSGMGTVSRVDLGSGKPVGKPIRFAQPADALPGFDIASSGSSVWVSSFTSNTVTRISSAGVKAPVPSGTASSAQRTTPAPTALPRGGKLVAAVPVPFVGGAFAVGEGAVWQLSNTTGELLRIDPKRNAVVARIPLDPSETAAAGEGAVWVTHPAENSISRIDPNRNKVVATIRVGPQPDGVAVSTGAVWVANAGGPSVSRIDPATNRVVTTIRVGPVRACCSEHMGVLTAGGVIWAAVPNGNQLIRIDPATNSVTGRVDLPYPPCAGLAADASTIWSAGGACADLVARVDIRTKTLVGKLVEAHPIGLALAFGSLWIAVLDLGTIDQVDPRTGRLVARLPVGGKPIRLATGFGAVWVNDGDGRVLRIAPRR
jgi:YVTN family beta-propeller protein